jgi:uncharacterized membrane protein YqhA
MKDQNWLEKMFEKSLWSMRFTVMLAVIFGLISALLLFIIASVDVYKAAGLLVGHYLYAIPAEHFHAQVLTAIIGSVDLYLIGVVLLIFSFGLYELFVSEIDVAKTSEHGGILEIGSLDELKNKVSKVIILVLVVSFFQRVLTMEYNTPLEMFYLALSIFALSTGLYFLHKHDSK